MVRSGLGLLTITMNSSKDATKLDVELRFRLLRALEAEPELSQRELAARMGLSLGKVNYCLKALMAKGWVKAGNFNRSAHKPRYWYQLTPSGLAEKAQITHRFLQRKLAEHDALTQEIRSIQREIQAGRHEGDASGS